MGRYTVSGSGADCKSVVFDSGGSTPSLPTIFLRKRENLMLGMVLGILYYILLISLGIFAFWGFGKWLWDMLTYFDS